MSRSNTSQNLYLGKETTVVDGKSHWKDFICVHIDDPQAAFTLAMSILRQLEHQRFIDPSAKPEPITFNLAGSLEQAD